MSIHMQLCKHNSLSELRGRVHIPHTKHTHALRSFTFARAGNSSSTHATSPAQHSRFNFRPNSQHNGRFLGVHSTTAAAAAAASNQQLGIPQTHARKTHSTQQTADSRFNTHIVHADDATFIDSSQNTR